MSTFTQQDRHLALTTVLGPDALLVRGFSGWEAISRPFSFDLDLLSENDAINLKAVTGTKATLRVIMADGSPRYWNGHISRITQGWRGRVFTSYKAEMVPWLWFLGLKRDCRIFQEKTAPDIIRQVFTELGFQDFTFRLHGDFPEREYCVQYRETDLQFVSRLMEEEGIFYFFEHEASKHNLVIANTPEAHQDCPNQETARCRLITGAWQTEDVITDWRMEEEYVSSGSALADYNFKIPTTDLKVSLDGETPFQIYDHPGVYRDRGRGEDLARMRLEETKTFATVARGESTCRPFTTGFRFKLKDHYREDWNQLYVLTEVRHHGTQAGDYLSDSGGSGQQEAAYQNDFVCIPYSTPFKPARHTPVPVVEGCQTAVVVGPAGEEIYTDKYGRIKVQFHWDRDGKKNEKSSCWIRVAQAWAGKGWGAMSLPRIGQEVVVDFLEGNPDRPIITGCVYNDEMSPPYALPANKDMTGLKSFSTKGGGGYNEIVFKDAKGSELVRIHGQKDMETTVLHDQRETVKNDKHIHVTNELRTQVDKKVSHTVNGDVAEHFNQNHAEVVSGERYLKANRIILDAGKEICMKVGGNHVTISSAGVYVDGTMVDVNCGHPAQNTGVGSLKPDAPEGSGSGPSGSSTSVSPSSTRSLKAMPAAAAAAVLAPALISTRSAPGGSPKLIQLEHAREMALLAQNVYNDSGAPPGYQRVARDELPASLKDFKFHDAQSGFDSALYKKAPDGGYVIAYAGTQDLNDWRTNFQNYRGMATQQHESAIDLAQLVKEAYPAKQIEITGHSLGGSLTYVACAATGLRGTAFNPEGVPPEALERYGLSGTNTGVTNYVTSDDPLSGFEKNTKLQAAGETTRLESARSSVPYPVAAIGGDITGGSSGAVKGVIGEVEARHSMDSVISSLDKTIANEKPIVP